MSVPDSGPDMDMVVGLAKWLEVKAEHSPGRIQLDEDEARLAASALRSLAEQPAQAERLREAEARYTVLLLDLLANGDITNSRAAELTGISTTEMRHWSLETLRTGQQTTFPFPAKATAEVQP